MTAATFPEVIFPTRLAVAELDAYRNIAANPYDLRESVAIFPHATASRERRNGRAYAARNAIDDQRGDDTRDGWFWDSEKTEELWWQVDFGRVVEIDKVVIVKRADFQPDSRSRRATLIYSDGRRRAIDVEKRAEPQTFTFEPRRTSSLRLAFDDQTEPPRLGCTDRGQSLGPGSNSSGRGPVRSGAMTNRGYQEVGRLRE